MRHDVVRRQPPLERPAELVQPQHRERGYGAQDGLAARDDAQQLHRLLRRLAFELSLEHEALRLQLAAE